MSRQFTQVGNAVPPLLAYFVATYIKSYIFNIPIDIDNDLKKIQHPVVKQIPDHLKYFRLEGNNEKHRQIGLFTSMEEKISC